MTRKKLLSVFIVVMLLLTLAEFRIFYIMKSSPYTEASSQHGIYTTVVAVSRPDFYDCNGRLITGTAMATLAVANPRNLASYNILKYVNDPDEEAFRQRMSEGVPFLVRVDGEIPSSEPIMTLEIHDRYCGDTLATHLIGYLGYEGEGVSGLEYFYNDYLNANKTDTLMKFEVNARGTAIDPGDISFYENDNSDAGIVLTIDSDIQRIAERIAEEQFEKGCIVILDARTSEIRAMVSRPNFDQNDVAAVLDHDNGALINRALASYNVGSVYKIVVAAAALEASVSNFSYECGGEIEVNGHTYTCIHSTAHGWVDLERALTYSCNAYFIALGQYVGSETIRNMAAAMGIGKPVRIADNFYTTKGYLPTVAQMNAYGELCNHCFGQGMLLASPVHVAAYTACIANGGVMNSVSVIKQVGDGIVEKGPGKYVMSGHTAAEISKGMYSVVDIGSGVSGKPDLTTAAGKSGTAQTGRYYDDGTEKLTSWFTGWFPADDPRYIVTVMTDDHGYSSEIATPTFKLVADAITAQNL